MSLGLATNSALGGLRLSALGTRVVAENLAQADAEGYGVRTLTPSNLVINSRNNPVQREVDPILLGATRSAESARMKAETHQSGLLALESTFGVPGEAGSLNATVAALESSLRRIRLRRFNPWRKTQIGL